MKRHHVSPAAEGWQGDGILFGCDYNPEQWPAELWPEDVRLMVEAGVDIVAINIFGWATVEPRPGVYDFTSLDAVIDLLHAHGIRVNLGTGTASPPPWLSTLHPEILPVVADGTTRWPGGRQGWCPSSPVFREYALRLVRAVAERYAQHPAIALWHVSNELGCHNSHCYCDVSAAAFRRWLESRYGTIERLNEAWGTTFWSQRYGDWAEVLPPRLTLSAGNPTHRLDFDRFCSDELLDYYRDELAVIRAVSSVPVTTNFMVTAHIRTQDYWRWAPEMDLVANDHYLDHRLPHPERELSFSADLTRGLAGGEPWMLMETSTSAVSWQPRNMAKAPGELARTVVAHVARGADGICFFQWRASRQGAEKFHSALLPHAGTDSKIWRESLDLSALLDRLAPVSGSTVEARVGVMFSWDAWWASESDTHPSGALRYLDQVHRAHGALRSHGVTADVIPPGAMLADYDLVVVPTLYTLTDAEAAGLVDYVEAGGHAVITFFSGVADEDLRLRVDGRGMTPPGAFASLLGAWTEEVFPLAADQTVSLSNGSRGSLWTEVVRPTTAEVIARFDEGATAGLPAITAHGFGRGRATYVATELDDAGLTAVMGDALEQAGVPTSPLGPDIECVVRRTETDRFLFVINHSDHDVELAESGVELTEDEVVTDRLRVPAGGVRVLRQSR